MLKKRSQIFLSYSRRDLEQARYLRTRLEATGYTVWIDEQGIDPTREWMAVLERAIFESHVFVFLKSKDSRVSNICDFEMEKAFEYALRVIIIDLDDTDISTWPVLQRGLELRASIPFEDSTLIERIDGLIRADLEILKSVKTLLERAYEWENRGRTDDFLLSGDVLIGLSSLLERADRIGLTIYEKSSLSEFVWVSREKSEHTQRNKRRRRLLRNTVYVSVFVCTICLFLLSRLFNSETKQALIQAQDRKSDAQEQIQYLLGDLTSVMQTGGSFTAISNIVDHVDEYFQSLDETQFDLDDYLYFSRMGHLLAEINLNQLANEEALRISEQLVSFDEKALSLYPDELDVVWNLAFSVFWLAESKRFLYGHTAAENETRRYYEIMRQHRDVSPEWRYEYMNGVYNLAQLYGDSGELNKIEEMGEEITLYYEGLVDPDYDQKGLFLDTMWLISRAYFWSADYESALEKLNEFDMYEISGNYYYDFSLALSAGAKADYLRCLGRSEEAIDLEEHALSRFYALFESDEKGSFEVRPIVFSKQGILSDLRILRDLKRFEVKFHRLNDFIDSVSADVIDLNFERVLASVRYSILRDSLETRDVDRLFELGSVTEKIPLSEVFARKRDLATALFEVIVYGHVANKPVLSDTAFEYMGTILNEPKILDESNYIRHRSAYLRAAEILEKENPLTERLEALIGDSTLRDPYIRILEESFYD